MYTFVEKLAWCTFGGKEIRSQFEDEYEFFVFTLWPIQGVQYEDFSKLWLYLESKLVIPEKENNIICDL